jgi:hypothetical protein
MTQPYSLSNVFDPQDSDNEKLAEAKKDLAAALGVILDPSAEKELREETLRGRFGERVFYHSKEMHTLAQPVYETLYQVTQNNDDPIQNEAKSILRSISLHGIMAPYLTSEQLIAQGVFELDTSNDDVDVSAQVKTKSNAVFVWYEQNKTDIEQLTQMKQELDNCAESSNANADIMEDFGQNEFDVAFPQNAFYRQMQDKLKILDWSVGNTN